MLSLCLDLPVLSMSKIFKYPPMSYFYFQYFLTCFPFFFLFYRYLCEFIYYTSLKLAEEAEGVKRVLFIHIPVLDEKNTVERITKTVEQVMNSCLKQTVWSTRCRKRFSFGDQFSFIIPLRKANSFQRRFFLPMKICLYIIRYRLSACKTTYSHS